jgi:hypothetical protein
MRQLKKISLEAVGAALEKALRYRLLNEPRAAESICLDVLDVDPDNQQALTTLILALTDQFDTEYVAAFQRAKAVLPRLDGEYDRQYYEGIIHERWALAESRRRVPGHVVTGWYLHAMHCYERCEGLAGLENPDAILRWNTCARLLEGLEGAARVQPSMSRDIEAEFGEETRTR